MDTAKIMTRLPTLSAYLEKRRKARQNRLPKHLRPLVIWPVGLQIALNTGLIVALCNLMTDRDDYVTEAGPAVVLVVCFLLLIYTMITSVRLKRFHSGMRGERLAKINLGLMIIAFLLWAASIVAFLPS
jgi:phosphatidylserine synthase